MGFNATIAMLLARDLCVGTMPYRMAETLVLSYDA